MNTSGNIRSQKTKEKIFNALTYLLKHKNFSEIYVKDICHIACINRSSFYEHFQDINDLMMKMETEISKGISNIFSNPPQYNRDNFVKMFQFVKDNKEFYTAYLRNNEGSFMGQSDFTNHVKLNNNSEFKYKYKENEMLYHMAFFAAGLNAMCKVWLNTGLVETPEKMADILQNEYKSKIQMVD